MKLYRGTLTATSAFLSFAFQQRRAFSFSVVHSHTRNHRGVTTTTTTTTTKQQLVSAHPNIQRNVIRFQTTLSSSLSLSDISSQKDVDDLFHLPPTPNEIPLTEDGQRVIGIGDIHGNFKILQYSLRTARLINQDDNWIGGNSVLVQTGDILDRGMEELECWMLLCRLARQAAAAGGSVVMLWGNHEFMCSELQFAYATGPGAFEKAFNNVPELADLEARTNFKGGFKTEALALMPSGLLSRPLLSKLKVAVKVGETVFVHGGLVKEHLEAFGGIAGMNANVSNWILGSPNGRRKPPVDPTWMRDYSDPPNRDPFRAETVQDVDDVLESLDASRMVVGHTPQQGINSALDGKVWRIDTGNWMVSNDDATIHSEVLEIEHCEASGTEVVKALLQVHQYGSGAVRCLTTES